MSSHPYLGLPCVPALSLSSPVLRKANVNAYPLCLQCVFTGKNTAATLFQLAKYNFAHSSPKV